MSSARDEIVVEADGHWGGCPDRFTEKLTVTVADGADLESIEALARLYVVLRDGGGPALRALAARADEVAADLAALTGGIAVGPHPFTL